MTNTFHTQVMFWNCIFWLKIYIDMKMGKLQKKQKCIFDVTCLVPDK